MNRTIADIFLYDNLEHSVLIGYYGGGNYGDELLLEVLMGLSAKHGVQALTVTYQHPDRYATYHRDFGYARINMADKLAGLRTILKNRNIIIGGGGLWGLDVNPNILFLGCLLFASRWVLRKRVYLLGVGYYNSTNWLGRISAWLAGKSANYIVARDMETLKNFQELSKHVSLDSDIAWHIPDLDLRVYQRNFAAWKTALPVRGKALFITLRHFKPNQKNDYADTVEACLADNPDIDIVVALMEPREVDPEGYARLQAWQKKYKRVRIIDFSYNPLLLYLFFQANSKQLALIAPQFHVILTAHLTGVRFFPVAYDNKVQQLLSTITGRPAVPIKDVSAAALQQFIDEFEETAA